MWWTLLICIGFIAVHLFKMTRLYLVLMEHKIKLGRFILLYLRTTFVNLIIPFKIGELYRVEEIARETKVWQVGVLSVLVDRFFDVVALFLVLLPFDLFLRHSLSPITGVFTVLIVVVVLLYRAFPKSYTYLNRYLIMRKSSKRSLAALKGMDIAKSWYDFTKNLITGRAALIVLTSFLGWAMEVVTLKAIASYLTITFGIGDFSSYIEAIFMKGHSSLQTNYTAGSAYALLICTVIGYIIYFAAALRRNRA